MICYKSEKIFNADELRRLFLSVEWSSGEYPEKLKRAMLGFGSVFSAWDGARLVGLIATMDDGVMNAYIHYLLVMPEYQHKGIGRELIRLTRTHYADYLRLILISYKDAVGFYQTCGFNSAPDKEPLFITSLNT